MSNQILIVDDNRKDREKLKVMFECVNYDVNITSSAAYAIARIVQGNRPIVIIGESFEEEIEPSMIVALMKKCSVDLKIILISDTSSLDDLTKLRKEGIFYHSLKPVTEEDNEEIKLAVQYAISH